MAEERGRKRRSRFQPAPARPRVGIVAPYQHRKGLTTMARAIESALGETASLFPVRKLARLDDEFARTRADRVADDLRHARVVPPRTPLVEWLGGIDVAILVERPFPSLCAWCRARGIRTIVVALPDWLPPDPADRVSGLELADAVAVYSRASADALAAEGLENVAYLPPSLDWPIESPRPPGTPRVVYFNVGIAGAADRRNVPLVLETLRELLPRLPDVRFVMKLHPGARKYLDELGPLPPRTEVIERELEVPEMQALQRDADLSLFPSRFEGLGLPLLESLHAGVPVLATDAPPMNEMVRDERNGLLVKAHAGGNFGAQTYWALDADHFRAQLERALGDADLLARLKAGATEGLSERRAAFDAAWRGLVRRVAPRVLNLGSGEDRREGVWNVDIRPIPGVDVVSDARHLPFADGVLDELTAQDLLEHFPRSESETLLDEWVRVLRPGGLLRVQTPDLRALAKAFLRGKLDVEDTVEWLYGRQDHPFNFHMTGFDEPRLRGLLEARGVRDIRRITDVVSSKNVCLEGRLADRAVR